MLILASSKGEAKAYRKAPSLVLVAVLLGQAAVAVRAGAHVHHVDVAFLVQVAEQPAHRHEHLAEVARLLVLRVALVGDADVEVEARLALLGERAAAHEPVGGVDPVDGDRGEPRVLAEDRGGELEQRRRDPAAQPRRLRRADLDVEDGHGYLAGWVAGRTGGRAASAGPGLRARRRAAATTA